MLELRVLGNLGGWAVLVTSAIMKRILEKSVFPTDRAMLAANPQMSNNFLHSGQNLDFVRETLILGCKNLWNIGPIMSFSYMTKRSDFFGLFSPG